MLFTRRRSQDTWADVRRGLESLVTSRPHRVRRFVRQRLDRTQSPAVVAGLARHPHSREVVRGYVEALVARPGRDTEQRLRSNPALAGAIAGAANLLLDDDGARAAYRWVIGLGHERPENVLAVRDSFGARPRQGGFAGPAYRRLLRSGEIAAPRREPARHRLVITENLKDRDALALLLPGAERATVFPTSDATGKATFDAYATWPGVGDVTVEHFRSRISRFSPEYVALHQATAAVAQSVAAEIERLGAPLGRGGRADLEVAMADFLFLQALKTAAIEALLDDERFDHVVVAVGDHGAASGYVQMLAALDRLREDPRVEVVSVSGSDTSRAGFWRLLFTLSHPPKEPVVEAEPGGAIDWAEVESVGEELAAGLGAFAAGRSRRRALLVTASNSAYNQSTAAYAAQLTASYDVRILHFGATAQSLTALLAERIGPSGIPPIDFLAPPRDLLSPTGDRLVGELRRHLPAGTSGAEPDAERFARIALCTLLRQLCHLVVLPQLRTRVAMATWFARLAEDDGLPDVVVLVPQRTVGVATMATVARDFRVPSVAVEPHFQDANYSRYVKISTDYYGVVSDYFRERAAEGFGIELDRVATVGTPRQVAPSDYDPRAAQVAARAELLQRSGIALTDDDVTVVFFAQPSSWTHVARVWRSVLEAGATAGVRILLKPHPEESPSRLKQYLTTDGAEDVTVLRGRAEEAVALADVVLTTYSAAAVDAVLRGTPVICVGDGDLGYPVDIPAIVDAPVARSAGALAGLLEEFKADPTALQARARRLLEREPQFVEGPGPRFEALVARATAAGAAGIRAAEELPSSRFLDGPHPTFPV